MKRRASVQKFLARPLPYSGSIRPVLTAKATASMRVLTRSFAQTFSRYPDAISDMLKVARHRGWDQIRTTGDEGFRREVWVQAKALGMEVKGYRPTERDRQAAGEPDRADRPRNDRMKPGVDGHDAGELKRRMAMAAVVVRTLVSDPAAQARLMERAWERVGRLLGREERDQTTKAERETGRRR